MPASSYDPLEVEELLAFGRRGVDNVEVGDTPLEEGGVLQPKGVWAEHRHRISPQRLAGMTMPIGVIEIEGDSHHRDLWHAPHGGLGVHDVGRITIRTIRWKEALRCSRGIPWPPPARLKTVRLHH
jgi:hypothetical protein